MSKIDQIYQQFVKRLSLTQYIFIHDKFFTGNIIRQNRIIRNIIRKICLLLNILMAKLKWDPYIQKFKVYLNYFYFLSVLFVI